MRQPRGTTPPDLLADFFAGSSLLMQSTDPEGRLLWANQAWLRALGYAEADIERGLSVFELVAPESRSHCQLLFQRVLAGEAVTDVEAIFIRRDGRRLVVSGESNCRFVNGVPVSTRGVFRDITAERAAEARIINREAQQDAVNAALAEGVAVVSREGIVERMNPAAERILGVSAESTVGTPLLGWTWRMQGEDGADIPREDHPALVALRTGQPQHDVVVGVRHGEHSRFVWLSVTAIPVRSHGSPGTTSVVASFRDITRAKAASDAVRHAEEQLRRLVRHTPAAMAMLDREMRYLAVSDRWMTDYALAQDGLTGDGLVGRSHYDVFPDLPEAWKAAHVRCLAGAVEESEDEPVVLPDGSTAWVRRSVRPWYTADGAIGGLILFGENVTSRVLADAERRRLAAVVNASTELVLIFDRNLNVVQLNPAAQRAFAGVTPASGTLPGALSRLVSPELVDLTRREGWLPDDVELETTEGPRTFSRAIITSSSASSDALDFVAVVLFDLTARRRLEDELRQRRQEFEALAENAPAGIARVDRHRRLLFANRQIEEHVGIASEALMGRTSFELGMPAELAREWDDALSTVLATGTPMQLSFDLETRRGSRSFVAHIQPEHDRWLATDSALFVLHDVTERRRAERHKEEIIGVVSHELRGPVTVIRGALQLLEGTADLRSARDRHLLALGQRSATRLLRMLNELLDLERLEAGILPLNRQWMSAKTAVDAAVELVESLAAERGLVIEVAGPEARVLADADRASQVLVNLLGNAVKFSPAQGRIGVRWEVSGPDVTYFVSDQGPGVPAAQRERIFERFAQVSAKDRERGTGLGLAIAKAIVVQHGGRIWVDSTPGQGSTFAFVLPGAESQDGAPPASPSPAVRSST